VSQTKIARRYAKALADICAETRNHAVIGKQLETFAATYASSAELQSVLGNPVVGVQAKRQILLKLFAKFLFAPTTRNFLLVLLENGRIGAIETIAAAFREHMDAISNRMRAAVVSSTPLERADLSRIQAALQRLTGKTVLLEARVDSELIGGVQVHIGNLVLDGSVATHLDNLRERLQA
jgi:F-type H+-transporting ATPase subunit delta